MLPVTKVASWSLEQAAVWIATRDPAKVVRYPWARVPAGVHAIEADLAKARGELKKADAAGGRIKAEIVAGGLILDGQADISRLKRACDHAEAMRKHVASLEAVAANAIAVSDSILRELQQALQAGALSAFGDIDGASKAPIDAAIWLDYQLAHLPLVPPAHSMTPAEKMPLTLRAVSYLAHPSSSVKRKVGPAHYDTHTRGTLHHRAIEHIVVDRATVMRLWPAPGGSRKPKTSRPGQAKIGEDYAEAMDLLENWFNSRFNRAPQSGESDAKIIDSVQSQVRGLTLGTARKAWHNVRRKFAKKSGFHQGWLNRRGRPRKRQNSDGCTRQN